MNKRAGYLLGGGVLILLGIFLPRDWYDALPQSKEQLPPLPIKGVTLLQIVLIIEGVILLWLSTRSWRYACLPVDERMALSGPCEEEYDLKYSTAFWLLAVTTLVALILRCIQLGSDLWLDEISPILAYGQMPVLHIVTTYLSSNNHLLNTLFMKLVLVCFGEQEWAIRLPAMLFGTATIPAIYWVSRNALSRRNSLFVAVLLAVSYHHIFFSQNARGYSAYLFFSVLSSGLLVKGLQEDRARDWVLYGLTMFLNFASLLDSIFVFASHVIVGVIALLVVQRNGRSPLPLARRLVAVFTITGALVLNLYITMAPQFYIYSKTVYRDPATGFSPFSVEFLQEFLRGLSAGLGRSVLLGVIPFGLLAATGFFILLRRQWALTTALALPGLLTALFLLAEGLEFSPRFFLLWLPLAMFVTVQGIHSLVSLVAQNLRTTARLAPQLASTLVLFAVAVSLFSLKRYYLVPKQPYRASIHYIEVQRQPREAIIVAYLAESGYRFYGKRFGLTEGKDWFPVRTVESLDSVLSMNEGRPSMVVTTFTRALRISRPDLLKRIAEGWKVDRTFSATIGDGEISVWKQRAQVAHLTP